MFEKLLSSVGIGSATVDTKLFKDFIRQGDYLEGMVEVKGGNTPQQIENIYLIIMTKVTRVDGDEYKVPKEIFRHQLNDPFTIGAEETEEFHFKFKVPFEVPFTKEGSEVWVATGLDIHQAVDPKDKDMFKVLMHPYTAELFQAFEDIGFQYEEVQNTETDEETSETSVYQKVMFYPITEEYEGMIESVTTHILPISAHFVHVAFEIRLSEPTLAEAFEEAIEDVFDEENFIDLEMTQENAYELKPILLDMLRRKLALD